MMHVKISNEAKEYIKKNGGAVTIETTKRKG